MCFAYAFLIINRYFIENKIFKQIKIFKNKIIQLYKEIWFLKSYVRPPNKSRRSDGLIMIYEWIYKRKESNNRKRPTIDMVWMSCFEVKKLWW